ncbi:zinc-finger homeodomain protein 6-like [Iris pallida]|uniref:Zinc-finger homeodomain protein 6-like n=1 Tax=Iris pallida TaxID=29817 RepID=A0AAX6DM43_IRIPA|nr:zinc-finger homeodomain protein 6-like [Iris pallida]
MDHFRIRTTVGEAKAVAESSSNDEPSPTRPFGSPPPPPPIVFGDSVFSRPILPATSSLLFLPPKPAAGAPALAAAAAPNGSSGPADRYRECLRNHAASLGAHVVDGCGEFMPSGPAEPLRCAACGCHRSFHRKEEPEPEPLLLPPPPPPPKSSRESSSEERRNSAGAGELQKQKQKRFRTKFSCEQKTKMAAFAERVGWRAQKKDEAEVERFCREVGVSRRVLKVWMHNNKHLNVRTSKQQQQEEEEHLDEQPQQYYRPQPAEALGEKKIKRNKSKKKSTTVIMS